MTHDRPRVTRRRFLEALGGIGGAGAVYHGLATLGLLRVPPVHAGIPALPSDLGAGRKVIVIGAGLAGLCSAYLLSRAGFEVKIVEANEHIGGRSLTLRPGDSFKEEGDRAPLQVCKFDEGKGLYLNAGPGRIPHHHTAVLNYCREFGVALEPFIFATRANLVQSDQILGGEPIQLRRLKHDTRGYIAEMLAKTSDDKLDAELSPGDRKVFVEMLRKFGDLQEDLSYAGTERAGYEVWPGAGLNAGKPWQPLELDKILGSKLWDTEVYNDMRYYWQASLLQPKGGMDLIVKAFRAAKIPGARTVDNLIVTDSPVQQIRNTEGGVEVVHVKGRDAADFCVSTMAPPLLARVQRDFRREFVAVLDDVTYTPACKVGWQAKYRFWEDNDTRIFGGISWTKHEISQIWYPSDGFFSDTGVLTGAYNRGPPAERFGRYSHEKRLEVALEGGEKLHRGFENLVYRDRGISIAWQNMPHIHGGWADETAENDPVVYKRLNDLLPEGRVYLAGDYLSHMPGWQEGAVLSAELAVSGIARRAAQSAN